MNYGCMSCGAKYAIPDARLRTAGVDGLRIRCSRCRAIMAVSSTMAHLAPAPKAVASGPSQRLKHQHDARAPGVSADAPSMALVTGVIKNPFADFATPDARAGHEATARDVTGVFLPLMASVGAAALSSPSAPARPTRSRLDPPSFYAAIDGRARGPYAAAEMLILAQKGKIRASTLVWKPGCGGWKPLKHIADFDVSLFLDAVHTRKRRERDAEAMAERRLGIVPVRIERHTVGSVGGVQAPALPIDAFDFDDATAVPTIGPGNEVSSPFLWRAPHPSGGPVRWPRERHWWAAAVVVVVVAALVTAAALPLF